MSRRPADPHLSRVRPSGSVIATDPAWFAATMAAPAMRRAIRAVDLDDWIARGRPDVGRVASPSPSTTGSARSSTAADVLARYGVPATVFLVTDRMGSDNAWPGQPPGDPEIDLCSSWSDAARRCAAAGFRFGAQRGPIPGSIGSIPPRLDDELRGSRDAIEDASASLADCWRIPTALATPQVRRASRRNTSRRRSARGSTSPRPSAGPVRPPADRRLLPPVAAAARRPCSAASRHRDSRSVVPCGARPPALTVGTGSWARA